MEKLAELIFVPAPEMGHMVSAMELAKLLIGRDDRIRITVLTMEPLFTSHLTEYTTSVAAFEPKIHFIDVAPVDPPSPEILSKSAETFLALTIESHIASVRDAVAGIVSSRSGDDDSARVVGLVLDFFCVSMIDVADEFGLPSYMFMTSNAAFLNLMLYHPTRHAQLGTRYTDSDPELRIPGFVNPVPPLVLPSAVFGSGYEAIVKLAGRFRDVKGIIVNTFAELEAHAISCFSDEQFHITNRNPPVYTVGPVLDLEARAQPSNDSDRASRDELIKWLDEQPPASVVFLCFGSRGGFSAPQVKETALALEHSGHRFLWSIREPLPEVLPEGCMERIKGRGVVCGWDPQVEILAHKAIGGFVSHCGWNSILESLWNRVPIVTWPLYAEQQLNAFLMVKELGGLAVELRLGSRMGGDVVVADEIESAVRRLMDGGGEVRKRVEDMGMMARNAVVEGGSSHASIGRLIEDLIGTS